MPDLEKVIKGLECCILRDPDDHARCSQCSYGSNCVNRLKMDALELLSAPDRVRVVRCRDCKHSKRMCQPWNDLICDKHGGANLPDWFCADGERSE